MKMTSRRSRRSRRSIRRSRRSRRPMRHNPTDMTTPKVILSRALVRRLSQWHSGMDAVYALTSHAYDGERRPSRPVSLEMIDKALTVLRRDQTSLEGTIERFRRMKPFSEQKRWISQNLKNLKHLKTTISQLQNVYDRHLKRR